MKKSGKKKQPNDAIDEVEHLLTLTQDDLLLKLTVNSHTKSKFDFLPESPHNNNAIHPDLDRRFQALRSKPSPNPKPEIKPHPEDIDNLLARFAALKAPANATSTSSSSIEQHGRVAKDDTCVDFQEEDEVSKIINWAIDAARLDPSPSDIDDDDDADDDDDSDEDSDDDAIRTVNRKKKESKK